MKTNLRYREQIRGIGAWLLDELDTLLAALQGSWKVEHTDDDRHGHVHAQSLQVGRVSFASIHTDTIATSQVNNYNNASLRDAGLWRIGSSLSEISLTGIQVPTDETGTILDARLLVIENTSDSTVIALEHDHTASSPANRFDLPMRPASVTGATSRYYIYPGQLAHVEYNSVIAKWRVLSRANDELLSYAEFGSSQNDYAPPAFRTARVVRLVPTAANLTISGFSSTNLVAPVRKTIINEGAYRFAILHMNTASSASNRVQCPAGSMYYLNPRESVDLYFETDGTWHIILKADQWVDVPFSAGNFTANGGGTWTVDSGDVETLAYQIDGNKMTVSFEIYTTDVTSGPSTNLQIAIPAGRTAARTTLNPMLAVDAGAAGTTGFAFVVQGGTVIAIQKDAAGTAWTTTAADNTYVEGQITFMVETACGTVSENHTDTAHGDTAHGDGGHTDVAHSDVTHVDSHGDVTHDDTAHSDSAHADSHSDVAHSDVAHEDVAHVDGAHQDAAHTDDHTDVTHGDLHIDFSDGFGHGDTHVDQAFFDAHGDTPHEDAAHGDSHSDVAHTDVSHSDSHSDTAHGDGGHSDTAHSDSHSDTPHSDTAHSDASHTDTVHADTPHADVGLHCDTNHADI